MLIALIARDGNMFTPEFFEALKRATDEVIVMEGIDRGRVQSLFTPNVRYLEVVEDGIEAGNVIPADFQPTPEGMARVRENILKAGIVGRLVANDFSGALVSAHRAGGGRRDGAPVDPIAVARELEEKVRDRHRGHGERRQVAGRAAPAVDVHMIGFAKVVGDIADGALSVVVFAVSHAGAHAAGGLDLLPVVPRRAGAGRVLGRRGGLAARRCWCCSATASIRSGCWCRS